MKKSSGPYPVHLHPIAGPNARPDGYEITYTVVEPRVIAGGINTLVGTNDGSLVSLYCKQSFISPICGVI